MITPIRVESAQRGSEDQQVRVSTQTIPCVPEGERRGRKRLRRALQLNDREMPSPREMADAQCEELAAPTSNLCLRPGTRRAAGPVLSRFEPRRTAGGPLPVVDLVGRRAIQHVMGPMLGDGVQHSRANSTRPLSRQGYLGAVAVAEHRSLPKSNQGLIAGRLR